MNLINLSSIQPLLRSCLLVAVVPAFIAGCSSVSDLLTPEKIDYKSAGKVAKTKGLEVPPDLTAVKGDSRYSIGTATGTATASTTASAYNAQKPATVAAADAVVAPKALPESGLRIERAGSQRWLVVKQSPDQLWPRLKSFWQEAGFTLASEKPEAGVMETDWAENRAKIPQDFLRNSIGRVFDSLYSTSERDKFRTRLERTADGSTEVYISHRGAEEKLVGQAMSQQAVWTSRPSDPELEAEFLGRLMAALSGKELKVTKAAVDNVQPAPQRARVSKDESTSFVEVDESFDRAWRRVGLALDRVGFTVEDRDRTRGLYFVRYVDQDAEAAKKNEPGFFSRLFGASGAKKESQRYRILVKGSDKGSRVSVQDEQGAVSTSPVATRILGLLSEQLK